MGSSGGGTQVIQPYTQAAEAEQVVTPAVGKTVAQDTESAIMRQNEARQRLRGIRSTYSRYSSTSQTSGGNGSSAKLG